MGWFRKAFGFSSQPVMNYVAPAVSVGAAMLGHPWVGAALGTFGNAANTAGQGGSLKFEDIAKDAAVNFGGAALTSGATNFFSSPSKLGTQVGAFNKGASSALASTASGAGAQTTGALSALDQFGKGAMNMGRASLAKGATNVGTSQSMPQKFASNITSSLGGGEIANLMYPNAVAIGGNVADTGEVAQEAGGSSGSAYEIFNPGNTVFDQASYDRMLSNIQANAGQQRENVKDLFRESGRWALTGQSDTPFGAQEGQISTGLDKTIADATQEFNDRAALAAIQEANPQYYNDKADTNYWLNEAASGYAPQSVMDTFGRYSKYARPIQNFKSYWAPAA